jgi:hypothetical protein
VEESIAMTLSRPIAAALTAAVTLTSFLAPVAARRPPPDRVPGYTQVVASVAGMVSDGQTRRLVAARGLRLLNVLWEDTGRWEGSAVGPNISDVTIEVEAGGRRFLMPVIRYDNFTDKTGDVKLDRIFLPVGNQVGQPLATISLRDFLAAPAEHASLPRIGQIRGGSLLAERDSHALVSAQHAFLPVPKDGKATFWPVIFNYQSYPKNPAVLTLLVTRQGTSMTIVDNQRDALGGGSWGQRLYFNQDGQKAPLIAERLQDVKARGTTANGEAAASLGQDANLLMIIQVPLKQKAARRSMAYAEGAGAPAPTAMAADDDGAPPAKRSSRGRSDVDVAVLGHGPTEGPFTELDGLTIERDPRFPVRVTVQFYQATSNGVVSREDVDRMAAQIGRVYEKADYVGSLVVPAPADVTRPTRWTGAGPAPEHVVWWQFQGLAFRLQHADVRQPAGIE